jgi:hypothetical protein
MLSLCLPRGNEISGGKLLSSRTGRSSSSDAALLRLADVTIGRSDTSFGALFRRFSSPDRQEEGGQGHGV